METLTHAKRAYGSILQPGVSAAKAILSRLRKGDLPTTFSGRDIQRRGWGRLTDRTQIQDALEKLKGE